MKNLTSNDVRDILSSLHSEAIVQSYFLGQLALKFGIPMLPGSEVLNMKREAALRAIWGEHFVPGKEPKRRRR